jgi:hypothetical protein
MRCHGGWADHRRPDVRQLGAPRRQRLPTGEGPEARTPRHVTGRFPTSRSSPRRRVATVSHELVTRRRPVATVSVTRVTLTTTDVPI